MTFRFLFRFSLISLLLSVGLCSAQQIPDKSTIRIGFVQYTLPAVNAPIVDATLAAIKSRLTDFNVEEIHLPREDLEQAVINGSVDIFLSSAGFYRRLVQYGARDLATAVSSAFPDPNHSDGTAIIVRNQDTQLQSIDSLKGRRLVITNRHGFSGFHVPMGEIVEQGGNRDHFFSSITEVGDANKTLLVLQYLKNGLADVAFVKQCVLEHYLLTHPEDVRLFRVITPKQKSGQCARSTDLYPTWTLGSTRSATPEMSRRVTSAVLDMRPATDGLHWGVATDYSAVDHILKNLQIGPYEHLRHWTLRGFIDRFWPLIAAIFLLVIGLAVHSYRVGILVKRRTADLEAALRQQEKLRIEATEAQKRLTAMQKIGMINQISSLVAHELRQPLGAIALYLAGLRTLVSSNHSDKATIVQAIDEIERQTQRADSIVQKVRSFRKNSGGISGTVNVSNIVEKALVDYRLSLSSATVNLTCSCEPDLEIRGDALELELLAVNLTKNAVEAVGLEEDGFVHVTLVRTPQSIRFSVTDNGPVRNDSDVAAVKNRMNTTKENGLGLGLQIVQGIVERHQAVMNFAVRHPCGLIVTVDFPLLKND